MHFWIDIEFTNILGQFKQKIFVDLFMIWNFKLFFNFLILICVNYNHFKYFLIEIFIYFDTSPKTHCKIM